MATNIKTINSGSNRITSNLNRLDSYNTVNSNKFESKIKAYNDKSIKQQAWSAGFGIGTATGGTTLGIASAVGVASGAFLPLAIIGGALSIGGAIGQGIFGIKSAKSQYESQQVQADYAKYQNYYNALTQNMAYYGTALENRDEIIFGARESLTSSLNQMSTTYGAGFTNALRSVFYGKNGIDASVKSLFNGNYSTFNEIGSGSVAGWLSGDLYDTSELTEDADNYFRTDYTQLEMSDLNQKITNRLYDLLMGGNTAFAEQVRGYETDVKNLISNALLSRRQTIQEYGKQFNDLVAQKQSADINSAIALGQAQLSASISGLRGASASTNVALQKMAQDMAEMEYSTQVAYGMSQMQNALKNIQLSVSQNVASLRSNEQLALKRATESAINSWNVNVSDINKAGYSANAELRAAYEYQNEMERNKNKLLASLGGI